MKNYRIKKVSDGHTIRYYPQQKFLWFWANMFEFEEYWDGSFSTFEEAQRNLCDRLRKPLVEYLEVNCEGRQ